VRKDIHFGQSVLIAGTIEGSNTPMSNEMRQYYFAITAGGCEQLQHLLEPFLTRKKIFI
jgi:hypothetical protein